jgi:hypothetical protein
MNDYLNYFVRSFFFPLGDKVDTLFVTASVVLILELFDHLTTLAGVEKFVWMFLSYGVVQVIWLTARYALKK